MRIRGDILKRYLDAPAGMKREMRMMGGRGWGYWAEGIGVVEEYIMRGEGMVGRLREVLKRGRGEDFGDEGKWRWMERGEDGMEVLDYYFYPGVCPCWIGGDEGIMRRRGEEIADEIGERLEEREDIYDEFWGIWDRRWRLGMPSVTGLEGYVDMGRIGGDRVVILDYFGGRGFLDRKVSMEYEVGFKGAYAGGDPTFFYQGCFEFIEGRYEVFFRYYGSEIDSVDKLAKMISSRAF